MNRQVGVNDRVETRVMPVEQALGEGALAFFGERYGDRVRVVKMGDFSLELCGGTHAGATGNLGYFAITGEGSVASGVRRIEAVTGETAVLAALRERELLEEVASRLHVPVGSLAEHVRQHVVFRSTRESESVAGRHELVSMTLKIAAA